MFLSVLRFAVPFFVVSWLLLAMCGRAMAQEELAPVQTVSPLMDQILVWVGAAIVILGTLASVLPPEWRLTQVLARLATDLRGIRKPDPSKVTKLPPIPRAPEP